MRRASCRWLRPLRWRKERIEEASCKWPGKWLRAGGAMVGWTAAMISSSSSSKLTWQRRQRLFEVRNWTNLQWSHLTTSRESTGARVVAMDWWECQSGHVLTNLVLRVMCGMDGAVSTVICCEKTGINSIVPENTHEHWTKSRKNRGQSPGCLGFTN